MPQAARAGEITTACQMAEAGVPLTAAAITNVSYRLTGALHRVMLRT
ncbi:MAG TPA: hypothetical protein VF940_22225 [Streptosporangiaceae bacterium]